LAAFIVYPLYEMVDAARRVNKALNTSISGQRLFHTLKLARIKGMVIRSHKSRPARFDHNKMKFVSTFPGDNFRKLIRTMDR